MIKKYNTCWNLTFALFVNLVNFNKHLKFNKNAFAHLQSEEKYGEDFLTVNSYIRKLTGCSPLAQSLYQLICENEIVTKTQKVSAIVVLVFS